MSTQQKLSFFFKPTNETTLEANGGLKKSEKEKQKEAVKEIKVKAKTLLKKRTIDESEATDNNDCNKIVEKTVKEIITKKQPTKRRRLKKHVAVQEKENNLSIDNQLDDILEQEEEEVVVSPVVVTNESVEANSKEVEQLADSKNNNEEDDEDYVPKEDDDADEEDDNEEDAVEDEEDSVEVPSKKEEKEVINPSAEKNVKQKTKISSPTKNKAKTSTTATSAATMYKSSKFHPVNDALWKKGQKMPYLVVAKALQAMSETTKRLKIVEIFQQLIRSVMILSPDCLIPVIYLCSNHIAASYKGIELGIGDATLLRAIANAFGRKLVALRNELEKEGDLGIVAQKSRTSQRLMFTPAHLTVQHVFKTLHQIASTAGSKSQKTKMDKIQSLLVAAREMESTFIIRSLQGKMRVGLAEQSILIGIAHACTLSPITDDGFEENVAPKMSVNDLQSKLLHTEEILKAVYSELPCFEEILPILTTEGIDKVPEKCFLKPGIPIKPMLAQPSKGFAEVASRFSAYSTFTCEYKYDGERAQIHKLPCGTIKVYSRNSEDTTQKYPDLIELLKEAELDGAKSYILDCEAVAIDRTKNELLPFQHLSTRSKKNVKIEDIKVPICIFLFDIMFLNGESLLASSLKERRVRLASVIKEVEGKVKYATHREVNDTEELEAMLNESVTDQCEGLMVKTYDVDAKYEPGKRTHKWLKVKKDYLKGVVDSLDLVPIGAFLGKGKRTGVYGGFLLACYNAENEEYQCICKIGTGFSDEDLDKHYKYLKQHTVRTLPSYYRVPESLQSQIDVWLAPVQVWEVLAADLTVSPTHSAAFGLVDPNKGISLRFPRFMRIREDKDPEDATDATQVAEMYNLQSLSFSTSSSTAY